MLPEYTRPAHPLASRRALNGGRRSGMIALLSARIICAVPEEDSEGGDEASHPGLDGAGRTGGLLQYGWQSAE